MERRHEAGALGSVRTRLRTRTSGTGRRCLPRLPLAKRRPQCLHSRLASVRDWSGDRLASWLASIASAVLGADNCSAVDRSRSRRPRPWLYARTHPNSQDDAVGSSLEPMEPHSARR